MPAAAGTELRLAELIAAISIATDLGMGQPMEQALRTCLLAVGLAQRLGTSGQALSDTYYLALVEHIACTADSYETALYTGGDEMAFRRQAAPAALGARKDLLPFMLRHFAADRPAPERLRLLFTMMMHGKERFAGMTAARCEVGPIFAERLGLSPGVRLSVTQALERWDGAGGPAGLAGEAISLPARIIQVAHDMELIARIGGIEVAVEAARSRRGQGYDPSIADLFIQEGPALIGTLSESTLDRVLASEPAPRMTFRESDLDRVADAVADMVDLKSPYLHGHSSGVSRLAESAAACLRCPEDERTLVRRAGLLHDVGRTGIPNGIWHKPGKLSGSDLERVRLHPYYTERVLSYSPVLGSLVGVAASHHERLDGSGYHRGSGAAQLQMAARILQAADVYQAMTQDRPHRPALSADEAARLLEGEAGSGRLDRQAVAGVLEAAGQRRASPRREFPAGLSEREVEVLRLLCRGETNRQMAGGLHITEKTVGHHVEHIYNKIGRSTRAGAALFAMESDLI